MKNQDVGNKDGCNNYMERKKLIQEMTVFMRITVHFPCHIKYMYTTIYIMVNI